MKVNYILLHNILKYLYENPSITKTEEIEKTLSINADVGQFAYEILIFDGYIEDFSSEDIGTVYIFLNKKGKRFLVAGGYKEVYRTERLAIKQIKSVIITNRIQRDVLWLTIGISALTLFITFYSAYKDKPIIVVPSKVIIHQIPMNPERMKQQTPADSLPPSVYPSK